MTNKNVKVTLQRTVGGDYRVAKISGRIVITANRDDLRAGDTATELQAEQLNTAYAVTVVAVKND
jgi:hypothetical protein